MLTVPQYPTCDPGFNPRATVYHPDADAVLLSGKFGDEKETPPPLQAGLGMPPACEAMWHDSAGQRRVDGAEYEE
jgi:hypothetical protein